MKEEALKKAKEILNDLDLEAIGADDTFDFKCQQCGRCCMDRTDIILNPFDVYNGAKYLGITPEDFLAKYTKPVLGGVSKIPIIVLNCDDRGWCPLLEFDVKDGGKFKCSINPAKPGACANHPLGIVRESKKHTDNISVVNYQFVKVSQCNNSKGHNNLNLVKEWCKPYMDNYESISAAHELQCVSEEYFPCRLFHFVVKCLVPKNIDSMTKEELDEFLSHENTSSSLYNVYRGFHAEFIEVAYAHYDIKKPFAEQAAANKEELIKKLFEPIRNLLLLMVKDMPDFLKDLVRNEIGDTMDVFIEENKKSEDSNNG